MIQIFFQFGTFEGENSSYWLDLLISIFGAFLGIVGAYWIYHFSIVQTRNDRLKYFVSLIESVITHAINQAEYCIDYSAKIKDSPFEGLLLKIEANRDFDRLSDKVNQEDIYHAFLAKYKRHKATYNNFRKIYSSIDFIDYSVNEILNFHEKTLNGIWERKKEFQLVFSELNEKIQYLTMSDKVRENYPAYVMFLGETLDKFSGQPTGENLVESFEKIVAPVRTYIMKNGPIFEQNTELMFLLNRAKTIFEGIQLAAIHASKDYSIFGTKLKSVTENLKKETEQLKRDFSIV